MYRHTIQPILTVGRFRFQVRKYIYSSFKNGHKNDKTWLFYLTVFPLKSLLRHQASNCKTVSSKLCFWSKKKCDGLESVFFHIACQHKNGFKRKGNKQEFGD